jgi:hypothetical protein
MAAPDPITSDALQALVVAGLLGPDPVPPAVKVWPTAAQNKVFAPRDWPTAKDLYPCILVQSPKEVKDAVGQSGVPQFNVSSVIRIVARVASVASTGDAGAMLCLTALGVIQRQIEIAVINYTPLMLCLKRIGKVEVVNGVKADGEGHLGEVVLDFTLEFYQGPDAFAPIDGPTLAEIAIFGDLINVFDPTGAYEGSPFPDSVLPAPRASGPDGRAELGGVIVLDNP